MTTADPARVVLDWAAPLYAPGRPVLQLSGDSGQSSCAVLGWAASGAMALTGQPGAPPVTSPAPMMSLLGVVTGLLAQVSGQTGTAVRADPAVLLTGRAGLMGLTRRGRLSAGGSTRLLRSADGWCAVTLSRPDDIAAVPAIVGGDLADPWPALTEAARARPAADLAARAQLVGVPAAALPAAPGCPPVPWQVTRIAAPAPATQLAGAVVADLSAMWAGPLCGYLLGQAGARVIKVESPSRPDGARAGDPRFFNWLHAGQQSLSVDFARERDTLAELLETADVVIEASRPRALASLGLAPGVLRHRPGQIWVSITGYGRAEPTFAAFGDDAAVAGGLVGWAAGEPVFCADAIADPLAGICATLAVACSAAAGGGHLIHVSMRDVAAAFAAAPAPDHGPHPVTAAPTPDHGPCTVDAVVACPRLGRQQAVAPPHTPEPAVRAPALGADNAAVLSWLAGC
jgi:hypothetical protein